MQHINTSQRQINKKAYWKTDNPNVVVETWTASGEIHLDKLQKRIEKLEMQIAGAHSPREYPPGADESTREAIDFWNSMNVLDVEELEGELAEKKSLMGEVS